jgi:hypothetical protein
MNLPRIRPLRTAAAGILALGLLAGCRSGPSGPGARLSEPRLPFLHPRRPYDALSPLERQERDNRWLESSNDFW